MNDINNYLKEINPNKIKFEKETYERMWFL